MGRRSAPPPAGTTRAKAAVSSGGDFFQAIGVPARSPSLALESRRSRRRRRRAMLGRGGSRDGEGHVRRRLLLGRGGSVSPPGRRRLDRRRLLGRRRPGGETLPPRPRSSRRRTWPSPSRDPPQPSIARRRRRRDRLDSSASEGLRAGTPMAWKKSPPELIAAFARVVPSGGGAERRPMFGYPAAFVNGNMFAGLHDDRVVLRRDEAGIAEAKQHGAT